MDGRPKQPNVRICDPTRTGPPEFVPLDPSEQHPILLKLHGALNYPESIVVTDEDYLVFIQKMSDRHQHPIHQNILARLNNWPVLFIGYSLKDYNLRLLFRTLRWHVDVTNFPLSFSVDPFPDHLIVSIMQHGQKPMVSFIHGDLWDFVPALYKECKGVEYQP
jgi:SIR2-like domain